MAVNDIYLGVAGAEMLLPAAGRTMAEGIVEVSREDRTASGRLVRDIVAEKKKFTLTYDLISHDELEAIAVLYSLQDELSLLVQRPGGGVDSYTVLLRPFDRERVTAIGEGYWTGVTLEAEQV